MAAISASSEEFVDGWQGEAQLAGYADLNRFIKLMMEAAAASGLHVPETDVHAGGLETSMMLAAFPELVRPFDEVTVIRRPSLAGSSGSSRRGFARSARRGVLGDVRGANAEAGEAIFAAMADELAGFFADSSSSTAPNLNSRYERLRAQGACSPP